MRRVFKLSDSNKDGLLDTTELNEFQIKCFDTPLQDAELRGVIEKVGSEKVGGVQDGGLTEEGFLYLNMTFMWKGQPETTWKILWRHGYANDLKLAEDFLHPRYEITLVSDNLTLKRATQSRCAARLLGGIKSERISVLH